MDVRVEMQQVTEELEQVEAQLTSLLEKQSELLAKKRRLEKAATQKASAVASKNWKSTDFEWSEKLMETLKSVFGLKCLRPLQLETMNATMAGEDCILIMPTGGGKSLCFQLPALLSKGVSVVVSPLVSLMDDQLYALQQLGINAALLNANSSKEEVNRIHAAMTDNKTQLKLLYVTPEKLAKSKRFMNKLEKMHSLGLMARLVIDEVHCCSQWGHDFRPDYKFLGIMKKQFAGVPILGLTATATSAVLQDVQKILRISNCLLFQASFNRHNLFYEVRSKPADKTECMDEFKRLIKSEFNGQSGIIYCFSQRDTEEVAGELRSRGIKASAYHAQTTNRSQVHQDWIHNRIQVVVATVAFGMGIDKPDVRFVFHHSISKSMENYYQESGRAGRDDAVAKCVLFASFADVFRQSTMVFTEQTGLEKLYGMVAYAYDRKRCRRTVIASHFGEAWDRENCNAMCDHCKKNCESYKEDISVHAHNLVALLRHCRDKDQRVTGNKLLDVWMGKGPPALRLSHIKPPKLSREGAEEVLVHLLVSGYLQEDFHFTPYSTISYVVPGSRAHALDNSQHTVEMVREKKPGTVVLNSPKSSKSPSNATTAAVKPVIVNPNKSKSSSTTSSSSLNQSSSSASKTSTSSSSKSSKFMEKSDSRKKENDKKKVMVIDSDSDLEFDSTEKKEKSSEKDRKTTKRKSVAGKKKESKKPMSLESENESDFDFGDGDGDWRKEGAMNGVKKPRVVTIE